MAGENYNPKELAQVFYNEYRDRLQTIGKAAPDSWDKLPEENHRALAEAARAMTIAYTIQVYGNKEPGLFEVDGTVGMSGQPMITVRVPTLNFRLNIEQAIEIADNITHAVTASMNEAFLLQWAVGELGADDQSAAMLIQKFRQFSRRIEAETDELLGKAQTAGYDAIKNDAQTRKPYDRPSGKPNEKTNGHKPN